MSIEKEMQFFYRMEKCFKESGFDSAILGRSVPKLIVTLPDDDKGRKQQVSFTFLDLSNFQEINWVKCLRFQFEYPFKAEQKIKLYRILNTINQQMIAGFLFFEENKLCFRYTYYLSDIDKLSNDWFLESVFFTIMLSQIYSELIEGVASEKVAEQKALNIIKELLEG